MGFFKRRQYVVLPNLQYKIINLHAMILVFNLVVYSLSVLYLYFSISNLALNTNQESLQPVLAEILNQVSGTQFKTLLVTGLFIMIFSYGVGMVVSNRIAGPIFSMNRHMKTIAETGQLKKLNFRKGDMLQETAEVFNQMVDRLSQKDSQRDTQENTQNNNR